MLSKVYPAIFRRILSDPVDDVVGVAAAALIPSPVVAAISFDPAIDSGPLLAKLWGSLENCDELSSSTHSIMNLLNEIVGLKASSASGPIPPESLSGGSKSTIVELVSRLFPFLSHSSTQVRTLRNYPNRPFNYRILFRFARPP